MAKIRSGATTDELTIDPTSKASRVTIYSNDGTERHRLDTAKYYASSGTLTVSAAAHGATAGWFWLINPVGSGKTVRIRRIVMREGSVTALATITSPKVNIERMSFTGTSSGAQITPAKVKSTFATATALLITASTGLTPTAGAVVHSFKISAALTAVGVGVSTEQNMNPEEEEEMIVLVAGEGIVCRQPDAATTSDTRTLVVNILWEEW